MRDLSIRLKIVVLCFAFLAFSVSVILHHSINDTIITSPNVYVYPIRPEMDEWGLLQNIDEMLTACEIPEERIKAMTTEELALSVFNYPLLINLHMHNTYKAGADILTSQFNGLSALYAREDCAETMAEIYKSYPVYSSPEELKELGLLKYDIDGNPYFYDLKSDLIEIIIAKCYSDTKNENDKMILLEAVNTVIEKKLEAPEVYKPQDTLVFYKNLMPYMKTRQTADEVMRFLESYNFLK